jgi:hypothetical protein
MKPVTAVKPIAVPVVAMAHATMVKIASPVKPTVEHVPTAAIIRVTEKKPALLAPMTAAPVAATVTVTMVKCARTVPGIAASVAVTVPVTTGMVKDAGIVLKIAATVVVTASVPGPTRVRPVPKIAVPAVATAIVPGMKPVPVVRRTVIVTVVMVLATLERVVGAVPEIAAPVAVTGLVNPSMVKTARPVLTIVNMNVAVMMYVMPVKPVGGTAIHEPETNVTMIAAPVVVMAPALPIMAKTVALVQVTVADVRLHVETATVMPGKIASHVQPTAVNVAETAFVKQCTVRIAALAGQIVGMEPVTPEKPA